MKVKKLSKTSAGIILVLLLAVATLIGACAQQAPAPAPTVAPTPTPATTVAPIPTSTPTPTAAPTAAPTTKPAKPILIKFGTYTSPTLLISKWIEWRWKKLAELSGGRVGVEFYYSGSLISDKQAAQEVGSGVADVGFVHTGFIIGQMPLLTVTTLPAIGQHVWPMVKAVEELAKVPEVAAEIDKMNLVYGDSGAANSRAFLTREPVYKLEDVKGMKLMSPGGELTKLIQALGAVPVSMVTAEAYTPLERGTIDGVVQSPSPIASYGFMNLVHYYYALGTGGNPLTVFINKNSWNSWPDDVKQMYNSLAEESLQWGYQVYEAPEINFLSQWLKEGKLKEINYPTKEEEAKVRQLANEVVWSAWVKQMNDKGLPGQKILDKWIELYDKYAAIDPLKAKGLYK